MVYDAADLSLMESVFLCGSSCLYVASLPASGESRVRLVSTPDGDHNPVARTSFGQTAQPLSPALLRKLRRLLLKLPNQFKS